MSIHVGRPPRRQRHKSRFREAFEEEFPMILVSTFKGPSREKAQLILTEHKRSIEDLDADVVRIKNRAVQERMDISKEQTGVEEELRSERERLRLLGERKTRMAKEGKPTEIVQTEMETSANRIFQLTQGKSKLTDQTHRLAENMAEALQEKGKLRQRRLQDTQRQLKELERE